MSAIRILAVDDEAHMQELIKWRFRRDIKKKKYEFQFALSGQEALEILSQDEKIDIILCDINMPEMNGLVLLEKIKSLPLLLKTIMVTAYENMENIRAAMNGGAFDFVTKPIEIPDLDATIQKAYEELTLLKAGAAAQKQLPLTQKALEETDKKARYLEELDEFKSRFFTNISHEFRTPLTVIRGISQQIAHDPETWLLKGNLMIQRNTDQLLDLVNQILDLRKLEAGQLSLEYQQLEVVSFIQYLSESFESFAKTKNLKLSFQTEVEALWMDLDLEKILRVMSNLLSNAIKFTPEAGEIAVTLAQTSSMPPQLMIEVRDSGIGIASDRLPHIFDRFYQVDDSATRQHEGTGIGLSLSKELVELMQGRISAQSKLGKGTQISITLPIHRKAQKTENAIKVEGPSFLLKPLLNPAIQASNGTNSPAALTGEKPSLLIVEDNPDIVEYLVSCLEDQYMLHVGRDGQEGINLAFEHVPDLIVSDVMMPKRDGFELCEILKTDQRTSHIPIVLLTAQADADSRLQGIRKGADAYLSKPFNQEELFIRLEKLLELRQALLLRYQNPTEAERPSAENFAMEDAFMQKIYEALDQQSGKAFYIPDICEYIGMSRSNLHRKVKALTGESSTKFIRRLRLERSKELLKGGELTISEIAYEIGFNDPSYFSKSFSQEYGVSPKVFRDSL